MNALEVRALTLAYRPGGRRSPVVAVDGADLTVEPGRTVALWGPSGSGKTTMMRCIAGLQRPDAGSITIDGRVVDDPAGGVFVPPEERPLGVVLQAASAWPHLDVRANVTFPLLTPRRRDRLPKAERERRVDDALAALRLTGLERRSPAELSGGQLRRLALARALVRRPAVLLLDEPFTGLDRALRRELAAELAAVHAERGFAAVLVTHDEEEAAIADRVVRIEDGRVRA